MESGTGIVTDHRVMGSSVLSIPVVIPDVGSVLEHIEQMYLPREELALKVMTLRYYCDTVSMAAAWIAPQQAVTKAGAAIQPSRIQ
jgi:hypothetical protein